MPLKQQAVLFRAAHHCDALEVELARRNIPFVKYGGLKFLEAAHVKDVLCVLALAREPARRGGGVSRAAAAARRRARASARARGATRSRRSDFAADALARFAPPAAARDDWPALCELLDAPARRRGRVAGRRSACVRRWYQPHLERLYDHAHVRAQDLEQLEQIAARYPSRERFLSELTLDPPQATGDLAGPPLLDEDYLILSTIHSAKGQEWDSVFVLNAADGCIPSDMATGTPEEIEEERRLLYVAMTRARDSLHLIHPLRFFVRQQRRTATATSTRRAPASSPTRSSIASSASATACRSRAIRTMARRSRRWMWPRA